MRDTKVLNISIGDRHTRASKVVGTAQWSGQIPELGLVCNQRPQIQDVIMRAKSDVAVITKQCCYRLGNWNIIDRDIVLLQTINSHFTLF
ncbi:hypothetical protein Bca4012_064833 [Brassica carinata]|uniref:Uncharacterized protein n=1 Tax=Brassica carinata TaxID=52824 RepID=A0A8X7VMT8_BRACI|nr:hypothetical protein Bca52824_017293 [Brassica carinata]